MSRSPHSPVPRVAAATLDDGTAGVLLISSSPRILHMNHRARTLLKMCGEAREWPDPGLECMPSILKEFCRDLLSELARRGDRDWPHFELRRVCHMMTPPLLLRGFAVSPASPDRAAQMMLTVQAFAPPSEVRAD